MKPKTRLIAGLALAFLSSGVSAEWIEIDAFEDGTRIYVDRATALRTGNDAEVFHLVRWGEPQIDPGQPAYLSTVVRTAYDCISKRERYLASTSYAGSLGNGAVVIADQDEAETWVSISDASMEEKLWNIACGTNGGTIDARP